MLVVFLLLCVVIVNKREGEILREKEWRKREFLKIEKGEKQEIGWLVGRSSLRLFLVKE